MTMEDQTIFVTELKREIRELRGERDALLAQLEGDIPKATRWLQSKVIRQGWALARLNQRAARQRFVLRTLEELGRGLTAGEYRTARAALGNEQLKELIGEAA